MTTPLDRSNQADGHNPIELAVNGAMWLGWVLLWLPLLSAGVSALGFGVFSDQQSATGSNAMFSEAGAFFIIGVGLISITLIAWAKYNQYRFAARHRRQTSDTPSNQQISEFFDIDIDALDAAKVQKIITLHFDNDVMRTELQPAMIESLKSESDSFMVADLLVSALLVQVRPDGEKRYFCRLSEYDWRPLASTDELSLDDARDLVRQMMNKRFDGVADNIRQERDLTLAEFIDRHYRDATDSILHTEQFQHDNASLSQVDESIHSHADLFTFLMDLKLTAITVEDIKAWQRGQFENGVDRSEVIYRTELLRGIYTRAVNWGVVSESPLNAVEMSHWLTQSHAVTQVA